MKVLLGCKGKYQIKSKSILIKLIMISFLAFFLGGCAGLSKIELAVEEDDIDKVVESLKSSKCVQKGDALEAAVEKNNLQMVQLITESLTDCNEYTWGSLSRAIQQRSLRMIPFIAKIMHCWSLDDAVTDAINRNDMDVFNLIIRSSIKKCSLQESLAKAIKLRRNSMTHGLIKFGAGTQ